MKKDYNVDVTPMNTPNLDRNTWIIRWAWCSLGVNLLAMAIVDRADIPITGYVLLGIIFFVLAYFKSTDPRRAERNTLTAMIDAALWLIISAACAYVSVRLFQSALLIILCIIEIALVLLLISHQSQKHQNRKT